MSPANPPANPHFRQTDSFEQACELLDFDPLAPADSLGFPLESLAVHLRDHRRRDLARDERSLEAH